MFIDLLLKRIKPQVTSAHCLNAGNEKLYLSLFSSTPQPEANIMSYTVGRLNTVNTQNAVDEIPLAYNLGRSLP